MEDDRGEGERAERAKELESLREGDAEFLNGDVIKNVRHGDADHGGNDEDEIYVSAHMDGRADFAEGAGQRQKQRRGDEANEAEATDGAKLRRGTFYQSTIKGPTERRSEGDEHSSKSEVSDIVSRLKPEHADGAEQAEDGTELELPLAQNVAFFRKHDEGEQGGDDDRRTAKDGVNTGADVKEGDRLGDLMDDIRQRRNQTKAECAPVETRFAAPDVKGDKRGDGEAGYGVAVKILRPDVVVTQQIELEERRKRPDDDGRKDREIATGKVARAGDSGWHLIFPWNFLA